ncbi:MAG: signal peptidase I [bacterium]
MGPWFDKWRDLVSSAIFYTGVGLGCFALVHFGSTYGLVKVDQEFRAMEPKLGRGHYVRINRRVDRPELLRYGDIIMYRKPMWKRARYDNEFARVVGKPGDVVELRDYRLWRSTRQDGKLGPHEKISEPYISGHHRPAGFSPFVVPRNCVFVLFDDRSRREPLRNLIVPARSIRGRVIGH